MTIELRTTCDLQLWEAEAQVSAQLGRLESSYERRDLHARPKEERALTVAMKQLERCLKLRAEFIASLPVGSP
jgi:hypothetical protein